MSQTRASEEILGSLAPALRSVSDGVEWLVCAGHKGLVTREELLPCRTSRMASLPSAVPAGLTATSATASPSAKAASASSSPSPKSTPHKRPNSNWPCTQVRGPFHSFGVVRPGGLPFGLGFPGELFGAVHGQVVLAKPGGGYQTADVQCGTVTTVSTSSNTVRSSDGFTASYGSPPRPRSTLSAMASARSRSATRWGQRSATEPAVWP